MRRRQDRLCARAAGMVMLLVTSLSFATTRPPSTEAERQHAIQLAQWLEEHPLDEDVKLKNTELLTWWTEVPDISFNWCAGILLEAKNDKARFVVLQALFGGGAYMLQHPESAQDREAIAIAGIESALRAYEKAKATEPKVRDKFLEELLKKRDAQSLSEYVAPHLKDCETPPKK